MELNDLEVLRGFIRDVKELVIDGVDESPVFDLEDHFESGSSSAIRLVFPEDNVLGIEYYRNAEGVEYTYNYRIYIECGDPREVVLRTEEDDWWMEVYREQYSSLSRELVEALERNGLQGLYAVQEELHIHVDSNNLPALNAVDCCMDCCRDVSGDIDIAFR